MRAANLASLGAIALGVAVALPGHAAERAPLAIGGPVEIAADKVEWNGAVMVYRGRVEMQSEMLNLNGDVLEFEQKPARSGRRDEPFEVRLTGTPARLHHDGTGEQDPTMTATAQRVRYSSESDEVVLDGDARLVRGKDILTGQRVRYNLVQRQVLAEGGGQGGRVKITLDLPSAKREINRRRQSAPKLQDAIETPAP